MKRLIARLASATLAVSQVSAAAAAAIPAASAAPIVDSSEAARVKSNGDVGQPTTGLLPGAVIPSAEVHPWWQGVVYHLATAPERVSDIVLQPGESLIAVAAGDTARWVIGDTVSGTGPSRRTHILVKPAISGLRTNLVITTDRRVYYLELESGAQAMTSIAWTYPRDQLLALQRAEAATAAAEPVAAPVAVERLNFNYAIAGDAPPWRPVRAFDDGRQVFIEFPASIGSVEAPPLFVIGASGQPELVNYRMRGLYYVVDRLFGVAELRLGEKHQQVVRITRSNRMQHPRRGGRAS
jgi:type IV secretion system protein VirB9